MMWSHTLLQNEHWNNHIDDDTTTITQQAIQVLTSELELELNSE